MNFIKKVNTKLLAQLLFAFLCILFVLPSVMYLIKNGTIYGFDKWFCFLLNESDRRMQACLYLVILTGMTIMYCIMIKNQKEIFKDIKQLLTYIAVISLIFLASISFTCSDVFYYLGIGRIDGKYNQNPYYTTIKEFVDGQESIEELQKDTVLMEGYNNVWSNTTVVYGPLWTLICKFVAMLSFGNIDVGIFVFRLINIIIHILNCYLIYAISKKKIFTAMYGLNPYMLLEGIMCIHNDIFVVCFILFAIYFLIKKKKIIPTVIFLALATAIKYFAILLLPLFIIYYFKNEKPSKRFLSCIQYGLLFVLILAIPYMFYIRSIEVFAGIFTMQTRFAKSFYLMIIAYFSTKNLSGIIQKSLLTIFIYIYAFECIRLVSKKQIKFFKEAKQIEYFLVAFLFLLITNFQPWYIMWLFPLLMWQKAKNIKLIVQISLISQFANSIFVAYTENWRNGIPFVFVMLLGTITCIYLNNNKRKIKKLV